ncbi:MAG: lysine 2,3-aminomutase [Candidatus Syntrophosphaera sp.]|nr:lysine 2,3-aminomutase [Candidatus Syntrophosphaera sp.]
MKHAYPRIEFFHPGNLEQIAQLEKFPRPYISKMKRVMQVFPFKTNNYVVNELIDWDNALDDPIFRLNFPHPDMMLPKHHRELIAVRNAGPEEQKEVVNSIRMSLNPNPAGQKDNVPLLGNERVKGIQHKYAETVLVFPSEGQTCHAYCTFCFRWPQFIGINDLKFATDEARRYQEYISQHREITDILLTGGDPMVMSAELLRLYIEPWLEKDFEHIQAIRIGSKSLAYWPLRYISDPDSGDILRLFEQVVKAGKHLAFQAHISHPAELNTPYARKAIKSIQSTGAIIRSQSPIMNHINNDAGTWHEMLNLQYRLGIVPYYMLMARNTGAHHYFAVPLARAYSIFNEVIRNVSGLCKTLRGPSMSTRQGKVKIDGVTRISGQKVFILSYLESRNPEWVNRPFFARYSENATWLDELQPAFDEHNFYFEHKPQQIKYPLKT